ncbi:MAG: hypothetical protein LQ338_008128 [Usnochroma carphineum]|nr:MAG: hypothetical protein LQ338_008128 [Usnochroma carphineum]
MSLHTASAAGGNTYRDIQISGNARVLLGNTVGQSTESVPAARADYVGQYANSSLRPVANYVLRPRLHQKIKEQLHDLDNKQEKNTRILVVCGLGGSGKSQLVLNYIQEYRRDYLAVFWIEAGSKETIERDYVQIYRLLYSRRIDADQEIVKVEDAVPAVKSWFQGREGRWLVVLDSADTIDNDRDTSYIDLEYLMPDAPGVHVVVTSRSSTAKEITQLEAVEVGEMEPSEAMELFRRSAKLTEAARDEIGEIVKELGYLALAITLAGSYVSVTPRLSSDIGRYLPEYRQRRKEMLQRRPKQHVHRYGESVLSTWEASYEAIESHDPAAARLLSLLAFVNFEDISIGIFDSDTQRSGLPIFSYQRWRSFLFGEQKSTTYELESAFETLQSYSLIQWRPDQRSYAMHKLVHAWGQDRLQADGQRQLSCLALELIAHATTEAGIGPSYQLRLVPHVMASFDMFSRLHESLGEITNDQLAMIARMGYFLYRIGRWSEAYMLHVFDSREKEKMYGKEHPKTLTSMNNLAVLLRIQGNYKEAKRIHRQVLALTETVLGKEHPSTLASKNNLGSLLRSQGNYQEAEPIYRQVLALTETVLGKEHPRTLTSMSNLANLLGDQGNCQEAEPIHRQVLALRETVLGKEHPDTIMSMNNLAMLLGDQGNYEEAERILRQELALSETVLGKEHPGTLTSMNNLVMLLGDQGNYKEAERILRQVLAPTETVLGKEHPDTLRTMNNLATVLSERGNYEEAERIHRQALASRETVLGKEHPDTLNSVHNLACLYHDQKRYKDAEELYQKACSGWRAALGTNHPSTINCSEAYLSMLEEWKAEEADNES